MTGSDCMWGLQGALPMYGVGVQVYGSRAGDLRMNSKVNWQPGRLIIFAKQDLLKVQRRRREH